MNNRSTPSPDTTLLLELALAIGELRYRVQRLEQSSTSSVTPEIRADRLLHLLERMLKTGPTLVHLAIWLLPKLAVGFGLLAAYLNGTIHAVLRFLLAHL